MLIGAERSRNLGSPAADDPGGQALDEAALEDQESSNGGTITIAMPAKVSPWSVAYRVEMSARCAHTIHLDRGGISRPTSLRRSILGLGR